MRVRIWFLLGSFIALILLVSFAFQEKSSPAGQQPQWPTRRELRESMFRSRGLQVVYSGADSTIAAQYRDYYQNQLSRGWPEGFKREYRRDVEMPLDSLGRQPLTVVGALHSNQILQRLLPQLPIQRIDNGFRFRGQNYLDADAIITLSYPHPANPAQMLTVITGNSDGAILQSLRDNLRRRWWRNMGDYHIAQKGQTLVYGYFQDRGPGAWSADSVREYDLRREEKPAKVTAHFDFVAHGKNFSALDLEKLAARYETHFTQLVTRLHAPPEKVAALPRLTVHLWANAEEKGLFTFNTDLRHLDTTRHAVHVLALPYLRGDDFFAEASLLLRVLWGESRSAALREGLAVALTEQWRGMGYAGWAARFVQTQNAPPLAELFDLEMRLQEAEMVRQPLLGSFAAFLLDKFGAGAMLKLYREWPESGVPGRFPQNETWKKLTEAWQRNSQAAAAIPLRHAQRPQITTADFHRGFCYAHEGYDIHNGYLGEGSREALLKLAALNVNAISITPFGFMREPNTPAFPGYSGGAGGESDESLIIAKNFAQDYRLRAMLKPHIWLGRSWPGDIEMRTPAEWKIFFHHYNRWMRGYATLAEMYGFDWLCVGVELAKATVGHEKEWRDMITRWRGLYSGPMVYAANWGAEFETVSFWDALDAIGIDCYYPLSEKENASDAELLSGAQLIVKKIRAVAEKFHKPVLVTEIGFTSTAQNWKNPHRDDRNAAIDLEAQRRCYEAICQAFLNPAEQPGNWLAGMYWWKWPSTLEDGGPNDREFTPNDKPAAHVVAKWYKQLARENLPSGQ